MKMLTAQDPETKSADLVAENLDQLKALFPEAFTEGKVDFEVLKQVLGGTVDEREEKYGLNWHGKRQARQIALTPSTGTLRPCPADSVDWETTKNLVIEGDNLEVLKLLQKSYAGKIKLIYIDPPYNTGRDFIYPDNFHDNIKNYQKITNQSEDGVKITSNPETSGRFHTDWLNMMYPRLKLSRSLMSDDGFIFVSCDDHEVSNIRHLLDDVFGQENFFSQIVVQSNKRGQTYKDIAKTHEYIIVYGRSDESSLFELTKEGDSLPFEDSKGKFDLWELRNRNPKFGKHNRPNLHFPIYICPEKTDENGYALISLKQSNEFHIKTTPVNSEGKDGCWRWSREKITTEDLSRSTAVIVARQKRDGEWNIYQKSRKSTTKPKSIWDETGVISEQGTVALGSIGLSGAFDHPKPVELIQKIVAIATEEDDVILDFFAGSGTTAHAVMAQNIADSSNRRFILVQLPELLAQEDGEQSAAIELCKKIKSPFNIAEITKERIRRSSKKLSSEGPYAGDKDLGFRVFKLDSSNIRAWESDRENLAQTLEEAADHLKTDRTEQDILFELLLKLGLDLTVPIETKDIAGHAVHSIGAGTLMVCLSTKIAHEQVEALALGIVALHKALAPAGDTTLVFRDSAFADDVAKTNMAAILQQHGLPNVRSL